MLGSIERMAIHQNRHQSDLEKRLRILHQQVHGKNPDKIRSNLKISLTNKTSLTHQNTDIGTNSDLSYLYQDLFKISILSTLALGAQAILFLFLKNNSLNINFF